MIPDDEWDDSGVVDGAYLLDLVHAHLTRYVSFPSPEAADAVTLWAAHAHKVAAFDQTPRLAVLSPEPGSGKSRLLETIEPLVPHPLHILSATTPAIFRVIAQGVEDGTRPTLLYDEVDAIFGKGSKDDSSEDLRALLNAGHGKGATIPRCVGPQHAVQYFPVFAAAALAGLGDLPDTLMTRSLVIRMKRRAPGERIRPFRRRIAIPEGHAIRDRLAGWAADLPAECGFDGWPFPDLPDGVTDRPADVWEPLLAMAEIAGGQWPDRAHEACIKLANASSTTDEGSLGVRLLSDIRNVLKTDRITTADLLAKLHGLEEAPWGDLRGKPVNAQFLARRLKPYGVFPGDHRFEQGTRKGYRIEDFHDAWSRYLPPTPTGGNKGNKGNAPGSDVADVAPVAPEATITLFDTESEWQGPSDEDIARYEREAAAS